MWHGCLDPTPCVVCAGPASPLYSDAASYLFIRALTAPIPLLLLTLQGCCRGLGCVTSALSTKVWRSVLVASLAGQPDY